MSVINSLKEYFETLHNYWNSSYGTLPQVPFDELINPMLYQGEPDEEEYVSWLPKLKETNEDFKAIESDIGLCLHSSIKEYFNSYWFLELQGFFHSKLIHLEPVEPGKDLRNFFVNQKTYEENQGKQLKNIHIGFISPDDLALVINNETGEVLQENFETGELTVIAESLEMLISELRMSK
ncbi:MULTISPECIES: SecY-interacting protein Syd [Paenibacillus]|uniref:SecY-interacting protein Syd n=1 Tax=Paenibacillus alvei TaxID=44250 RepID=A0ABT4E3D0_PAEAL|nr:MULTISPECIES: SecY-interacting protein Syd [Paenibacillus]EPY12855.1 hypothetical protein PAAL66ix_10736 [Paenibacillus alvei A6-6i-x]MCY9528237.1 SecY-interacting protein Syd [Paenibacillus alvei]SDF44731.1 Syd protein (SUKH-2) [Paenibacillus sp. cl6col]